jgi:2,3-bisphosphoglycerate-independent phosphoglycerate mutase
MSRCALIIIDGFGVAPPGPGNARSLANLPTITQLEREVPNVLMQASGNAVGLPEGQQGASEPGHLTIGAGRIVWQPLEEINRDIRDGSFDQNKELVAAMDEAKARSVPLHLLVIYSNGGVHGHMDHLHATLKLAKQRGLKDVKIHLIGDGRDVPEKSLCKDLEILRAQIDTIGVGTICSVIGRFYAMDRDTNWEKRTKVAYDLYTQEKGEEVDDLCGAIQEYYVGAEENQDTDYYIPPLKTPQFTPIESNHVVINLNFRTDRELQITAALTEKTFTHFDRPVRIERYVCMGPYSHTLPVAYPEPVIKNNLGEWLSAYGAKQLRISETEKYAHVTFFFNSQEDEPYPGEDRVNIPSPKVPSYDQKPEMSAAEVTDRMIQEVESEKYDFILLNYANPDLVGHSGDIEAEVIACQTVDAQLARLLPVLEEHGYDWVVTADHGNAEQMLYEDGRPCPSHTTNPVQTFVHSQKFPTSASLQKCTGIKDLAPMCLAIMEIPVPEQMRT